MPLIIQLPSSVGELLDKISILEIKLDRIVDPNKIQNIKTELAFLSSVKERELNDILDKLEPLQVELKRANEAIWQLEDDIRECERTSSFDGRFVAVARSIYRQNDRRAELKRSLNELAGSGIIEEKSYAAY